MLVAIHGYHASFSSDIFDLQIHNEDLRTIIYVLVFFKKEVFSTNGVSSLI